MKKLLILFLLLTINVQADNLVLPFDCMPREVQEKFAQEGKILDLDIKDRTRESWAYLSFNSGQWVICTYKPATQDDFKLVMKVINVKE